MYVVHSLYIKYSMEPLFSDKDVLTRKLGAGFLDSHGRGDVEQEPEGCTNHLTGVKFF